MIACNQNMENYPLRKPCLTRLLRPHAPLDSSHNWKPFLPADICRTFRKASHFKFSAEPGHKMALISLVHFLAGGPFSILQLLPKPPQRLRVFPITVPPNKVQDKLVARGEKCLVLHFVLL